MGGIYFEIHGTNRTHTNGQLTWGCTVATQHKNTISYVKKRNTEISRGSHLLSER